MIVGVGIDLVSIPRFSRWTVNMRMRFFSEEEILQADKKKNMTESLAGAFAVKEAFGKALGIGLFRLVLKDIVLAYSSEGQPRLMLRGSALRALEASDADKVFVSIAHEKEYALATVIAERSNAR